MSSWFKKLKTWWYKLIGKKVEEVKDVIPVVMDPPDEEKPAAAEDPYGEVTAGFSMSGNISCALKVTKVSSSMVYFDKLDLDWPEDDGCCGESRLGVLVDGKWWGPHKHDHVRRTSSSRDWKNVAGGYGKFSERQPVAGDKCALVMVSYDGKSRTSAAFFTWAG